METTGYDMSEFVFLAVEQNKGSNIIGVMDELSDDKLEMFHVWKRDADWYGMDTVLITVGANEIEGLIYIFSGNKDEDRKN